MYRKSSNNPHGAYLVKNILGWGSFEGEGLVLASAKYITSPNSLLLLEAAEYAEIAETLRCIVFEAISKLGHVKKYEESQLKKNQKYPLK